jgi:hypothetical protein
MPHNDFTDSVKGMDHLPSWISDDPHALMQLLLEGDLTLDSEDTSP